MDGCTREGWRGVWKFTVIQSSNSVEKVIDPLSRLNIFVQAPPNVFFSFSQSLPYMCHSPRHIVSWSLHHFYFLIH